MFEMGTGVTPPLASPETLCVFIEVSLNPQNFGAMGTVLGVSSIEPSKLHSELILSLSNTFIESLGQALDRSVPVS